MSRRRSDSTIVTPSCELTRVGADRGAMVVNDVSLIGSSRRSRRPCRYWSAAGFAQSELYGKGLAAGLAIVLLGVMLDRITQAAARRTQDFQSSGDKR